MARYPDAEWKPITVSKARAKLAHNRVNAHVAVSNARSLHPVFNKRGAVDSHLYVRRDGSSEQYVDTDVQAFADLEGSDGTISIETQGGVDNPNSEPWTEAQVETIARIYAWAVKTHNIQVRLATSSKLGNESKGLSWHRLGCDGNFPPLPSILAGRAQRGGGMRYSKSRGKICPGDAKIMQMPEILERAIQILGGVAAPSAPRPPAPPAPARPSTPSGGGAAGVGPLDEDGKRGRATIRRWQEIMGTPVDGVISKKSQLIIADQKFLNRVMPAHDIRYLTGYDRLAEDGDEGARTIKVRQAWLFGNYCETVFGRVKSQNDFDGIAGKQTTILHQYALNRATPRSGRY